MHIDAATEKLMTQSTGMIPLRTTSGIKAFYQSLGSNEEHVVVMEGNLTRMRQKTLGAPLWVKPVKTTTSTAVGIDSHDLRQKVQTALMRAVSKLLKVKLEDIDGDTELNEYGFDSISLTEFANRLNQEYQARTDANHLF